MKQLDPSDWLPPLPTQADSKGKVNLLPPFIIKMLNFACVYVRSAGD